MSFYFFVNKTFTGDQRVWGKGGIYKRDAEPALFSTWEARGLVREATQPEIDLYDAGFVDSDTAQTLVSDLLGGASSAGDTLKELEDLIAGITVPVAAEGADVDAGTDEEKFVTAKAIADSGLGGLVGVTPEADGTYTPVTITIENGLVTGITEA